MMNGKTRLMLLIAFTTVLYGCIGEDYFGLSGAANITGIEVSNQASPATIRSEDKVIEITFPNGIDLSTIEVQKLELSSLANANVQPGDILNFNSEVSIDVTSENGTTVRWILQPQVATENPQLSNSDFNEWYQTSANYFEPGKSAETTIWGTGNPGTQLLNIYATTPIEISTDNFAARLETLDNGALPSSLGFPISAATIYTGSFNSDNLDPTDPRAAIDFGTNFSGRPQSFSIDYSYIPGSQNRDKDKNPLPYGDQCDIYILLEVRDKSDVRRLATAWFRSGETQPEPSTIEVNFVYGELDASYPDYMKPADGAYVSADSASFILPTHLTFVATSSFEGDLFNGAVGSLLILDELKLNYDE